MTVFGDDRYCVTLGRGLLGRWEISVGVDENAQGRGVGRAHFDQVRRSVPAGEPVFAQVAPGNARSMRMAIAAGFRPIGAEVLLRRRRAGSGQRPDVSTACSTRTNPTGSVAKPA